MARKISPENEARYTLLIKFRTEHCDLEREDPQKYKKQLSEFIERNYLGLVEKIRGEEMKKSESITKT